VTQPLISYDIAFLKQQARQQIKEFVTEKLPTTVSKVFVSLDLITAKAWETVANAEREHDERTKMQALSLINSVEAQKIEIVSNVGIVDQVITAAERLQQRQRDTVPQDLGELKEEENTVERNVQRDITDKSDTDITQPAAEDKPLFTRAKAIPLHPEDEEK
jgi:adenine-specific DNA methylase